MTEQIQIDLTEIQKARLEETRILPKNLTSGRRIRTFLSEDGTHRNQHRI